MFAFGFGCSRDMGMGMGMGISRGMEYGLHAELVYEIWNFLKLSTSVGQEYSKHIK